MHAWIVWLVVAAALAVAELLSMSLVLIMLAGAAAAAGLVAYLGVPAIGQFIVAIAGSLALLLAVRPIAKRHLTSHSGTATGVEALVGRQAVVLSVVDANDGRVRLNGGEWSARSYDPAQVIAIGASVQVMRISGATAIVWSDEQ